MEREILFRGKRVDNNEWVYGFYWKGQLDNGEIVHGIIPVRENETCLKGGDVFDSNIYRVQGETVGELTSDLDSCRNKIFEGDILADNGGYPLYVCVFDCRHFGFYTIKEYIERDFVYYDDCFVTDICTIVGNIHDNRELLGEKND